MTDTFTVAGVGTWSPLLITSDDVRRRTSTVVHDLIDGGVSASIRPAGPRSGTLEILTAGASDAAAGIALLTAGHPVQLDADPAELSMRFVVVGEITQQTITDTAQRLVTVTVPFREIPE